LPFEPHWLLKKQLPRPALPVDAWLGGSAGENAAAK
jgi:hypothetical protein